MDAATDWVVSGGRYALDFDGTDDKVAGIGQLNSFSFIQNTGVFSISFWAKFNTDNTRLTITGNTLASSEKGFFLIREYFPGAGDNVMRIVTFAAEAGKFTVTGSTDDGTALAGSWNHWSFISTYSNNIGQWYLDGRRVNTTSRPLTLVAGSLSSGDSSRTLGIGNATFSSDVLLMDGQIDDLLIHNRALSPSEIRLLATRRGIAFERRKQRSIYVPRTSSLRRKILAGQT